MSKWVSEWVSKWVVECHSSVSKSPWHDYVIHELKNLCSFNKPSTSRKATSFPGFSPTERQPGNELSLSTLNWTRLVGKECVTAGRIGWPQPERLRGRLSSPAKSLRFLSFFFFFWTAVPGHEPINFTFCLFWTAVPGHGHINFTFSVLKGSSRPWTY